MTPIQIMVQMKLLEHIGVNFSPSYCLITDLECNQCPAQEACTFVRKQCEKLSTTWLDTLETLTKDCAHLTLEDLQTLHPEYFI